MGEDVDTWDQQVRRLYAETESQTAKAMEELVARESFGELLARLTENVMSVTRISNDAFDLLVRNLRLAGRRDVTKLAIQLARTEDKLEMVLQEIERLRDDMARDRAEDASGDESRNGAPKRASRSRAGS